MFTLQSDGSLVLSTTQFPQDSPRTNYWSAGNTDIGFQVIFNQSGLIYLTSNNGTILATISPNTAVSNEDFYQRATLDYDGVLRHYVYPKSSSSRGSGPNAWSTSSFIPSNICTAIVEKIGGGACGINSLCRHDDQRPTCRCPNGYTFIDPYDELQGCKQNFVPQSCGAGSSPETDAFDFQELQNTDMPYMDFEFFQGLFVKLRKDNCTLKEGCLNSKKKDDSTLIFVGSVLLSSLGILNFILPLITYLVVSRIYSRKAEVVQPYQVMPGVYLKYFTYDELKQATNEFKEELGRGASATVFKGFLASDKGKFVAVKSLDAKVRESDLEFNAEVSSIGRTNHRNLVQLLGFCNEGQHRILVYEFMSNGSLASFLFAESRPNWYQRRQIALGTARGLLYLHEECSSQIIHCDIKPQNILLDDSFAAKISDFGLAKLLRMDQTRTNTGIRGTKGYVAPEWFKNSLITPKVDVYSFGILLLEIICCRKKFDEEVEDEDQMILADWAYDCYKQKKLHLLLDNNDEAMEDIKKMEKYMMIAMWCIQEDPSLRPTMKNTIQMLEGIVEVSIPPNPSSFRSSSL
ncbi:hypothetical protein M0R45_019661 [Rubus argutus]|uniref:non-specific serine/threonine protein kinase n=1 Tax=Rubus argutus TaxID=59490 RepID=A0AAW1X613_RUBAR